MNRQFLSRPFEHEVVVPVDDLLFECSAAAREFLTVAAMTPRTSPEVNLRPPVLAWVLGSSGAKCGAPHFAPNPECNKIRSN
jgi:hypothetical protein